MPRSTEWLPIRLSDNTARMHWVSPLTPRPNEADTTGVPLEGVVGDMEVAPLEEAVGVVDIPPTLPTGEKIR